MKAIYVYRLLNLLSLDVAAGAVCMSWFACRVLHLDPPVMYFVLLGQCIWGIYLTDHLYDARKAEAFSYRRRFYKKYARVLTWIYVVNILAAVTIFILYFSVPVVFAAIPAFVLSALYIFFNWYSQGRKKPFYAKEFLIALGYVFGIMVIPMAYTLHFDLLFFTVPLLFFLMAFWNVLVMARYEQAHNTAEGQTSMGQWMSLKNIQRLTWFVFFVFLLAAMGTQILFISSWRLFVVWTLIALYMLLPLVFIKLMATHELYRVYADRVFLLPVVLLLLEVV